MAFSYDTSMLNSLVLGMNPPCTNSNTCDFRYLSVAGVKVDLVNHWECQWARTRDMRGEPHDSAGDACNRYDIHDYRHHEHPGECRPLHWGHLCLDWPCRWTPDPGSGSRLYSSTWQQPRNRDNIPVLPRNPVHQYRCTPYSSLPFRYAPFRHTAVKYQIRG